MINKTGHLLALDSWTYSWAPLTLRRFPCCLPEPRQEAYLFLGLLVQPKFKISARYRSSPPSQCLKFHTLRHF